MDVGTLTPWTLWLLSCLSDTFEKDILATYPNLVAQCPRCQTLKIRTVKKELGTSNIEGAFLMRDL